MLAKSIDTVLLDNGTETSVHVQLVQCWDRQNLVMWSQMSKWDGLDPRGLSKAFSGSKEPAEEHSRTNSTFCNWETPQQHLLEVRTSTGSKRVLPVMMGDVTKVQVL